MTTYRMHGSPISPYARKVMILARVHGIELDVIPVQVGNPEGYTGGDNPLGKIPALEWHPGQWLFDSPVICEWLDAKSETPLLPDERHRRTIQQWQHALGDGISDATYNLRYETVRPEELHWPQIIARHELALRNAVDTLEQIHAMLGEAWSYGNVAVVCGLDYMGFRAPQIDWRSRAPGLATWFEEFTKTAEYKDTYAYD